MRVVDGGPAALGHEAAVEVGVVEGPAQVGGVLLGETGDEGVQLIDAYSTDTIAVGESFDAWCTEQIKPWVDDHIRMDQAIQARWAGQDIDLNQPLPSDLILAAAEADPSIRAAATGYLRMTALPSSLRAAEPRTHALYTHGWRPSPAPAATNSPTSSA